MFKLTSLVFVLVVIGLKAEKNFGLKTIFYHDHANPEIQYVDKNIEETPEKLMYKVVLPQENGHDFESLLNKDENLKDYVIIKSKRKVLDLGPYTLVKRLDEIKYMVLWLNLYCEMHPDCDDKKLNEELAKVTTAREQLKMTNQKKFNDLNVQM